MANLLACPRHCYRLVQFLCLEDLIVFEPYSKSNKLIVMARANDDWNSVRAGATNYHH